MFRRMWICSALALCATLPVRAQAPRPIVLTLESGADLGPGKIAVARGTASANQVRFAIQGVDVAQPITVVVASNDPTRGNLEKLRCIYRWNKEYSERATSFGDNVSSVHGISGLAWQQERRKIERAVDELGVSYDAKYRELLRYVRADRR